MATLTDEEKAAKLLEGVDEPKAQDEPKKETDAETTEEESPEEATTEEEKPTEAEAEPTAEEESTEEEAPAPTFTKQFANLKGDSWEEYGPELEKAYQNSFDEGLKLRARITELESIKPEAPAGEQPAVPNLDSHPAIAYAQAQMQNDMVNSFNEFAKRYPQARETDSFNKFEAAAKGVSSGIAAAEGRVPTYKELFEKTAQVLNWQPSDQIARKDAAIKEAGAESSTNSVTKPVPKVSVTEKELEIARKLVGPSNKQDDSELVKDLAKIKA